MDPTDNLMNVISDNKDMFGKLFPKNKKGKFGKDESNTNSNPLSDHLKKKPKFQGIGNLSETTKSDETHDLDYLRLKRFNEICCSDMQNNTKYPTSFVILKCLENNQDVNTNIGSGLTMLAEDLKGHKTIVIIHDYSGDKTKFTNGITFRVFSPHYIFLDNKSLIKVSQAENIMLDREWEEFGKSISLDEKKADEIKIEGNKYFENNNYEQALESYSNAIALFNRNPIFYSNRSFTYYHLGLYYQGLKDAEKAISLDIEINKKSEKGNTNKINNPIKESFFGKPNTNINPKFIFRKIVNLIGLEEYDKAAKLLEENINTLATDSQHKKILDDFKLLLVNVNKSKNQSIGKLDYIPFIKCYKEQKKLPDMATFIGNVEILPSKIHGRGLFASKDLKQGEIIIVSKALVFTRDQSTGNNDFFLKLELSQKLKEKLKKLSNSCNYTSNKLVYLDYNKNLKANSKKDINNIQIDIFKPNSLERISNYNFDENLILSDEILNSIIEHNSYIDYASYINISKIEDTFFTNIKTSTNFVLGSGLWFVPSFFNNSCIENVSKFFIEDYMIVFTNKNISQGEELLMSYCEDMTPYEKRKEIFESRYIFVCNCTKCNFEKENLEKLANLKSSVDNLFKNTDFDKREEIIKLVKQIEGNFIKLEKDIEFVNNYSLPLILLNAFNVLDNTGMNLDMSYNDIKYKILYYICKMDNLKFYWIAKFLVLSIEIVKFDGNRPDEFEFFNKKFAEKFGPLDDFIKEWLNLVR